MQLKPDLCQEEYLGWALSTEQRMLYAQLRSGSHHLRIERGRWVKEPEEERVCKVCISGRSKVRRIFCWSAIFIGTLREKMYKQILVKTGYDMGIMKEDQQWLLEVLIGYGLSKKETRRFIGEAVAEFLVAATRLRAPILN